ncbi:cuscuta receptor 1-like isoform X2 [Populus alba]|uniref:cuscuta receptor 1-like isoform X2 n=1 Tax=Populus alba TaxID=43335 RepID=UPI00158F16B9|nr:receptor like protein 21-like isoform X4 [Populus alba]
MDLNRFSSLAGTLMIYAMVLSESWWSCHGCLDEERSALLRIQSSFNYPIFLQSWGEVADCCSWEGVGCNFTTGRVVYLDLSGIREEGLGDLYLNVSLFRPFQELQSLHLSGNFIVGCVENEGFERLSGLDSLVELYLDENKFDNNILSSLGGLSSLISLSLSGNQLKGAISVDELNNLTSLQWLEFGGNEIESFKSIHGTGYDLLRLRNLEYLGLNPNHFNDSTLSSLKGLSSLKYLDIAYNQLKGSFNVTELDALINLESLDLAGNEIDKFVLSKDTRGFGNVSFISLSNSTSNGRALPFTLLQSLTKFPNLRTLYLDENNLEGSFGTTLDKDLASLKNLEKLDLSSSTVDNSFLQTVGKITTLKSLSLHGCRLNGSIPKAQGLCQLKHLQNLDISGNDLSGALPWCLANLTSLQHLYLSSNNFIGDISFSPLTSLTSIRGLFLSNNHFQIPVSLSSFLNHSQLKDFDGRNNEIYVEELEEHNLAPKFQLERLSLSNNRYGGAFSFPKFLLHQYNLQVIYFSNLKLRGGFPIWLLENNTNLNELYLVNNSLSGTFQLPIHPHQNLNELDISNNNFESYIPREIGSYFPSLTFLSMSDNHFSGRVPSSFDFLLFLQVLDLSNNNIFGTLPSFFNSSNLLHVYLSRNMLQGSLEHAFQKSFELITLDLSHNHLTGSIPKWIGEFSQLSFLLLGYNNLDGSIPTQLCKLKKLSFIDLSHNNFSGHILPCLRFKSIIRFILRLEYPSEVNLREPLVIATKSLSYSYSPSILYYMTGLDLSCNSLSGAIPPEIGNLNHIHVLNLSNNHLIGPIPQTLSNLSEVESIDLSNNSLNGEIPPQLVQLHSLAYFSVANNNLSGKTPEMVAQFSTFNKSSYKGNPLLCGPPLLNNCTKEVPPPPPPHGPSSDEKEESSVIIDAQVFYVSFVVTYIMVLLGIAAVLYINPDWRRAWFYFIEKSINTCYYFVADNLFKPFRIRVWKPLV